MNFEACMRHEISLWIANLVRVSPFYVTKLKNHVSCKSIAQMYTVWLAFYGFKFSIALNKQLASMIWALILNYSFIVLLMMSLSSRTGEFRSLIGCEDDVLQLKCNRSSRLAIYSASFGRTEYESVQCPQPKGVPEECKSELHKLTGFAFQSIF